jgi:hypothetical protein
MGHGGATAVSYVIAPENFTGDFEFVAVEKPPL